MKPHKNLDAWKLSFAFVKDAYKATIVFPSEEKFGLVSQIRRAAVSIPVNIAEGSLSELDTLIELSVELDFCSPDIANNLLSSLENIFKRIFGLIRKLDNEQ